MIGRASEAKTLNRLYNSGRAEFVAIYGRRRVGKTFLVDETFSGRITFRHAGLSPADCRGHLFQVQSRAASTFGNLGLIELIIPQKK